MELDTETIVSWGLVALLVYLFWQARVQASALAAGDTAGTGTPGSGAAGTVPVESVTSSIFYGGEVV